MGADGNFLYKSILSVFASYALCGKAFIKKLIVEVHD